MKKWKTTLVIILAALTEICLICLGIGAYTANTPWYQATATARAVERQIHFTDQRAALPSPSLLTDTPAGFASTSTGTATPDLQADAVLTSVAAQIYATLTAGAPTSTNTPTITRTSTATITPTPTFTPTPEVGAVKISPMDNMPMVYIPAGDFLYGNNTNYTCGQYTQDIRHRTSASMAVIHTQGYWIDQTEVDRTMYGNCVKAGVCNPPFQRDNAMDWSNGFPGEAQYAHYPANSINYRDAVAYCRWVGKRIPHDTEWEKAARGTNGQPYVWGYELLPEKDSVYTCRVVGTEPKDKSPFGVLDMGGNVSEWTDATIKDHTHTLRIIRGGNCAALGCPYALWGRDAEYDEISEWTEDPIGFRCVSDIDPELIGSSR